MTTNTKSKALPVDPAAVAQEIERRESLALNEPLQRGKAAADGQEKANRRGELTQRLRDLMRVTLNRDTTQAGRDAYDRCWRDCEAKAQRFANGYGEALEIPAYLPPPVATVDSVVRIVPGPVADGRYRESKGLSPDGTGLPLRGPGSNTDPNWTDI